MSLEQWRGRRHCCRSGTTPKKPSTKGAGNKEHHPVGHTQREVARIEGPPCRSPPAAGERFRKIRMGNKDASRNNMHSTISILPRASPAVWITAIFIWHSPTQRKHDRPSKRDRLTCRVRTRRALLACSFVCLRAGSLAGLFVCCAVLCAGAICTPSVHAHTYALSRTRIAQPDAKRFSKPSSGPSRRRLVDVDQLRLHDMNGWLDGPVIIDRAGVMYFVLEHIRVLYSTLE